MARNWSFHAPVDLERTPAFGSYVLPGPTGANKQDVTITVPTMDGCEYIGTVHVVPDPTMQPGQVNVVALADEHGSRAESDRDNSLAMEVAAHVKVFGDGVRLPTISSHDSTDQGPNYASGGHTVVPTPEQRTAMGSNASMKVPVEMIVRVAPGANVSIDSPSKVTFHVAQGLGNVNVSTAHATLQQPFDPRVRPTMVRGNIQTSGYFAPRTPWSGDRLTIEIPSGLRGKDQKPANSNAQALHASNRAEWPGIMLPRVTPSTGTLEVNDRPNRHRPSWEDYIDVRITGENETGDALVQALDVMWAPPEDPRSTSSSNNGAARSRVPVLGFRGRNLRQGDPPALSITVAAADNYLWGVQLPPAHVGAWEVADNRPGRELLVNPFGEQRWPSPPVVQAPPVRATPVVPQGPSARRRGGRHAGRPASGDDVLTKLGIPPGGTQKR